MTSDRPLPATAPEVGVIIVDHGSRSSRSNDLLVEMVAVFAAASDLPIVEPAHMALAEPSLATAFARCVRRGATHIVVQPYFLLPGRHWQQDLPQLAAVAARPYPGVSHVIGAPLGDHPLLYRVIEERIQECLRVTAGNNHEP